MRILRITADCDGLSLQAYLRQKHGFSTAQIRRLKRAPDCVLVNGRFRRMVDPLSRGDQICLTLREDGGSAEANRSLCAPIVYEDDDLLIYNKPAALPVHRSVRHRTDTLENLFAARCADLGEPMRFRPLNRLDRNTTGLCAVAKNAHAAHRLSGNLQKEYLAVCGGVVAPHGVCDAPIARAADGIILRRVAADGKRAVTEYHRLACGENRSLVTLTLHTGRTHQIRVHMAYLGHPLLGDALYGGDCRDIDRQALHCAKLRFVAPSDGRVVALSAPLPDDMAALCASLSPDVGQRKALQAALARLT